MHHSAWMVGRGPEDKKFAQIGYVCLDIAANFIKNFGHVAHVQSYQVVSSEIAKKIPKNAEIRILPEE